MNKKDKEIVHVHKWEKTGERVSYGDQLVIYLEVCECGLFRERYYKRFNQNG